MTRKSSDRKNDRWVECLRCGHQWISRSGRPRCKCGSISVRDRDVNISNDIIDNNDIEQLTNTIKKQELKIQKLEQAIEQQMNINNTPNQTPNSINKKTIRIRRRKKS